MMSSCLFGQGEQTPRLEDALRPTARNATAWKRHILPASGELLWETIPWKQSFAEGLRAASSAKKPLILYAMNGHPLGCT